MPDPSTYPNPVPVDSPSVMICPRCDRYFYAPTSSKALEMLQTHVAGQHPDHDPEWSENG